MNDEMGTNDLDPTNPVVLAMAIKQMQATLKELVAEVRELSKRPTCTKPDLCVSLDKEVDELRELAKEWQKIAQAREQRVQRLEHEAEQAKAALEAGKKLHEEFDSRLTPLEDKLKEARGAKWVIGILWTVATSGVLTWIFLLWKVVERSAK